MLPGGRGTNPTTRGRGRGRGGLRGARAANNDGRGGIKRQAHFNDGAVPSGPAVSRRPGIPRGAPGSLQATRTSRNAAPSTRGIPIGRAGSTAVRSHDAPQGGDMAAFAQRYQVLKKRRERERVEAIKNGFLADPDRPRTLAEAITPVGTCQDMCAEFERVERVVQNDVWGPEVDLEAVSNGASMRAPPDETRMVKKFRRAAAGIDEQLPSDLRPPLVLQKTIDYLFNTLIGQADNLESVHHFVWDRTRAIRNDFSIQQITRGPELHVAIASYERIARFHILSLHQLAWVVKPYEKYDSQQEREQLDKTLLSLMQYYDDSRGRVQSRNEAEFRAYCIIFQIQDPVPNLEDRVQTWPVEILKDGRVQRALKLYKAASNTADPQGPFKPGVPHAVAHANWRRFWKLIRSNEISYLMACVAEIYFALVRRTALNSIWQSYRKGANVKNEDWTLEELIEVLGFEDEDEVQRFCEDYGFTIVETDDGTGLLDLTSVSGRSLPDLPRETTKQRKSGIVERKRHRRTLPAVINGMSVRAAREAGLIEEPPIDDVAEQDIEDEDSLFLPNNEKPKLPKVAFEAANPFARVTSASSLSASAPAFAPSISNTTSKASVAPSLTPPMFGAPPTQNFEGFGSHNTIGVGSSPQPAPSPVSVSHSLTAIKPNTAAATSAFVSPFPASSNINLDFGPSMFSKMPSSTEFSGSSTTAPSPSVKTSATTIPSATSFTFGSGFKPALTEQNKTNPFGAPSFSNAAVSSGSKSSELPKALFTPPQPMEGEPNATRQPATAKSLPPLLGFSQISSNSTPPTTNLPATTPFGTFTNSPSSKAPDNPVIGTSTATLNQPPAFTLGATSSPFSNPLPKTFQMTSSKDFNPLPSISITNIPSTPLHTISSPFNPSAKHGEASSSAQRMPLSTIPSTKELSSAFQESLIPANSATSQAERKTQDDVVLDDLARRMVLEPSGFLDQFIEFTIGPMIRAAQIQVEEERKRKLADGFRAFALARKYGKKWRALAWNLTLARMGREKRARTARGLQEKLRRSQMEAPPKVDIASELQAFRESARSSRSAVVDTTIQVNGKNEHRNISANAKAVNKQHAAKTPPKEPLSKPHSTSRSRSVHDNRQAQPVSHVEAPSQRPQSGPEHDTLSDFMDLSPMRQSYHLMDPASGYGLGRRMDARVDETRSTYFKLKARGLDPNAGRTTQPMKGLNERKRSLSPETGSSTGAGKRLQLSSPPKHGTGEAPVSAVNPTSTPRLETKKFSDEDEALFAAVRTAREAMSESISFFRSETSKMSQHIAPSNTTNSIVSNISPPRFSNSLTAATARARLDDLNRSYASSTTSAASSLLTSQPLKSWELPPKYRNRVSKFLPRNLYADVLMQQRRELGGGDVPRPRRHQYGSSVGSNGGRFRDTISRVMSARNGFSVDHRPPAHHEQVQSMDGDKDRLSHENHLSNEHIEFEEDFVDGREPANGYADGDEEDQVSNEDDEDNLDDDEEDDEEGDGFEDTEEDDDEDGEDSERSSGYGFRSGAWGNKGGTSADDAIEL